MQMINCYIPVDRGKKISNAAWGLYNKAKKLANLDTAIRGILVHTGMLPEEINIPFDEVINVEVGEKEWYLAETHVTAYQEIVGATNNEKSELLLFSASPLYQEIAGHIATIYDRSIITNVMSVDSTEEYLRAKREIYQGKAAQFIQVKDQRPVFVFNPAHLFDYATQSSPRHIKTFSAVSNVINKKCPHNK